MSTDLIDEINRLRALDLSPKQIARSLNIRPAQVSAILRERAATLDLERVERGELDPLDSCFVNASSLMLLEPDATAKDLDALGGFAEVFVARKDRQRLSVCSYLVDYWCLGVKDSFGPRNMDRLDYEAMLRMLSDRFNESFVEISLEQAQSIVFGSVDYARKLGIEPHEDFTKSQPHLGTRPDRLMPIEFGKNGKPLYMSGPYDNPKLIASKLDKAVGKGNYDFIVDVGSL